MATQPAVRRWTYDEFARLPEDGSRHEIIGGDLYVTPSPRPAHQEIVARLTEILRPFVRTHHLGRVLPGPIDVLFAAGDYLEPDLAFVRQERRGIITPRGIEAAPDLVIEVVSGSTARRDRGIKRERYAWFGVAEYWIIDADAGHVEVYRMLVDPAKPQIVRDLLVWSPVPGGPTLKISVGELLADLGEG